MSKELNITTGITGQSWTASTYLLGVAQTTGIAVGEIGTTASYSGDMTGAAGVYLVLFFLAASGQATFGGVIAWDGTKEILQTGDNFARLGAPAGASIAADIATRSTYAGGAVASVTGAVGSVTGLTASDVGAIKAKTDNLPTVPASTTNITGGTITTTTNLTNAPTAGDLTAAMKASVTTAATAATPTLSAAGNTAIWAVASRSLTTFGTLVADVATAVWAAVTRTLTDYTAPDSAATIAAATAAQITTDHGAGSYVRNTEPQASLDAAGVRAALGLAAANLDTQLADLPTNAELATALGSIAAPPVDAGAIADAVLDELLAGHTIAGSAGAALSAGSAPAAGAGALTWIPEITYNTVTGLPAGDVDLWITTDEAGANVVASGRTGSDGLVTQPFHVDAGHYYVFRQKDGLNFARGEEDVA